MKYGKCPVCGIPVHLCPICERPLWEIEGKTHSNHLDEPGMACLCSGSLHCYTLGFKRLAARQPFGNPEELPPAPLSPEVADALRDVMVYARWAQPTHTYREDEQYEWKKERDEVLARLDALLKGSCPGADLTEDDDQDYEDDIQNEIDRDR